MNIISIRWRQIPGLVESSDFVYLATNEDGAKRQYARLKAADINELFDITTFSTDTFDEALAFIVHENSDKGVRM